MGTAWRLVGGASVMAPLAVVGAVLMPGAEARPTPSTLEVNATRVDAVASSGGELRRARSGDQVEDGGRVVTRSTGRATVSYFDGSFTRIGPSTTFHVKRLDPGVSRSLVQTRLDVGRTWHRVAKSANPASRYDVSTGNAVASVRGTAFSVVCRALHDCEVAVVEGQVLVRTAAGQFLLGPGEGLRIGPRGAIGLVAVDPDDPWISYNLAQDAGRRVGSDQLASGRPPGRAPAAALGSAPAGAASASILASAPPPSIQPGQAASGGGRRGGGARGRSASPAAGQRAGAGAGADSSGRPPGPAGPTSSTTVGSGSPPSTGSTATSTTPRASGSTSTTASASGSTSTSTARAGSGTTTTTKTPTTSQTTTSQPATSQTTAAPSTSHTTAAPSSTTTTHRGRRCQPTTQGDPCADPDRHGPKGAGTSNAVLLGVAAAALSVVRRGRAPWTD